MDPATRALPAVWLAAAVPVGILGYVAFATSEIPAQRHAGLLLVVLAGFAVLAGCLLLARPGTAVLRASLAVSLLWSVGAVLATVAFDFGTDRLLLGGPPGAVAVITAMLALRRLRS